MQQALHRSSLVPRGFVVESACYEGDKAVVTVRASGSVGLCPSCRTVSRRIHSRYRRRVTDLPLSGRVVELLVIARRFRCDAVLCGRKIPSAGRFFRSPSTITPNTDCDGLRELEYDPRSRRLPQILARGSNASARRLSPWDSYTSALSFLRPRPPSIQLTPQFRIAVFSKGCPHAESDGIVPQPATFAAGRSLAFRS
jgi:hypothetical protein